jgi:hypothetical protein
MFEPSESVILWRGIIRIGGRGLRSQVFPF